VEHTLNDGRHEQRDRVQRSVNADGDEHVDPDLPVLECMEHVLGVVLVRERRAILRQAVRDLDLLFCRQELRGGWVVVHAEKSSHSCSSVSTVDRMNGWL
jgi:hypothetical protein